ncbi:hypothetical protein [Kluyvera sichuanensis]
MKKLIISALALAAITAAPAHAINAHYREQLERSGCNEMNAGHGCDIHKTKAQNAAHAPKVNTAPYLGKWTVTQEDGQELPDLVLRSSGATFGGDAAQYSATPAIADDALFFTLKNKMSFTLKKNGEGRWVSPEGMGTLKRQ